MENQATITVEATVNAPVEKVWEFWNSPAHITKWNRASDDWFTPTATNDLQPGGKFNYRMEARDGSWGFDFGGEYKKVQEHKHIEYNIGDGRQVSVTFTDNKNETKIVEVFEPETTNSIEMQQTGWQAILDSFKKYVETTKE
ncbi:uncharacterized protein YndB with AHSA1/START domain [Chitinophaga niastensis]|uniref:Uncharacterized protein YndB with AHSA1/START domain n=1 Tax=Chitinophaga niastensis TaxID=536980 RepID=A0A2P8HEW9_CHINA|nr:SRPBCC family protein [Chitinophaga niastensis]PSL44734.1 uncharacterized protein YndB with AHSA1/START domain [Chitinophaga niastensis]